MSALPRILLALIGIVAAAPDASPSLPDRQAEYVHPLRRFRSWFERLQQGRESIDSRPDDSVRVLFGDLRIAWSVDPGRGADIATTLLDFLGWVEPVASLAGNEGPSADARDLAQEALVAHLDPEFVRWLARDVLALRSQPFERRLAALRVLSGRHDASTLLPLLSCAREDDPRIRQPALESLVGWNDPSVHSLFLEELSRALGGDVRATSWLAEKHFASVVLPPAGPHSQRLRELVERGLSSTDWREVSRALTLSRSVENEEIVPRLIEALAQWERRKAAGAQALRVEMEILRHLESRSGRKFGLDPATWSAWWRAVRLGEVRVPVTGTARESTRASFFGLRPATDRVTFVIDRSGSMATQLPLATGKRQRTRWNEAVEQLLGFVEAIGPQARFGIVLFHDYAEEWRPKLAEATPENERDAGAWLASHYPSGGTRLQSGILRAMRIAPDGIPDLALLESDTIIVLCDGETAEGPDWVEPFLHRANLRARVVFHCVQVGAEGDGTLQKLAAGSGGDFVRVDG